MSSAGALGISIFVGADLFALLMAFGRITALLSVMPLVSMQSVPIPVRVGLGALLAMIVAPGMTPDPEIVTWHLPRFALRFASEVFLGAAMGFVVVVVFSIIEVGGTFLGNNSGLGMAVQFDPVSGSQALMVTRIVQVAGFLVFFCLNIHHQVLLVLVESFDAAPPGQGLLAFSAGKAMSEMMGQVFLDSMKLAMPVVATVLFLNLVSTLVTRFAQQMNIYFSVGLPANAMGGLIAIGVALPVLVAIVARSGDEIRRLVFTIVGT